MFRDCKVKAAREYAKGARRDAFQVAANGAVTGLLVLFYAAFAHVHPKSRLLPLLWIGFAASLAGANADTWGTELGILNPRSPILLTTLQPVPLGASGGVSLVGSLGAWLGAMLVAGMAVLVGVLGWAQPVHLPLIFIFLIISLAGLIGPFVDYWLGATFQAGYTCTTCDKLTEKHPFHFCGTPTVHTHGLLWLNNDWVNTACTLCAGLVGVLMAIISYHFTQLGWAGLFF